jgi:hypothetical protein
MRIKKAEKMENEEEILTQKEEINAGLLEICFLYMYMIIHTGNSVVGFLYLIVFYEYNSTD